MSNPVPDPDTSAKQTPVATNALVSHDFGSLLPYRQKLQALAMQLGETAGREAYAAEYQVDVALEALGGLADEEVRTKLVAEFCSLLTTQLKKRIPEEEPVVKEKRGDKERKRRLQLNGKPVSMEEHLKTSYAMWYVGLPTHIETALSCERGLFFVDIVGKLVAAGKRTSESGQGRNPKPMEMDFPVVRVTLGDVCNEQVLAHAVREYAVGNRNRDFDQYLGGLTDVQWGYIGRATSEFVAQWDIVPTMVLSVNL